VSIKSSVIDTPQGLLVHHKDENNNLWVRCERVRKSGSISFVKGPSLVAATSMIEPYSLILGGEGYGLKYLAQELDRSSVPTRIVDVENKTAQEIRDVLFTWTNEHDRPHVLLLGLDRLPAESAVQVQQMLDDLARQDRSLPITVLADYCTPTLWKLGMYVNVWRLGRYSLDDQKLICKHLGMQLDGNDVCELNLWCGGHPLLTVYVAQSAAEAPVHDAAWPVRDAACMYADHMPVELREWLNGMKDILQNHRQLIGQFASGGQSPNLLDAPRIEMYIRDLLCYTNLNAHNTTKSWGMSRLEAEWATSLLYGK